MTVLLIHHPNHLYHHPETPLIASFFGEFSVIKDNIYYAHQLKVVEHSDYKATVNRSYFNGQSWLIEANYNDQLIFISHQTKLNKGAQIYFEIDK